MVAILLPLAVLVFFITNKGLYTITGRLRFFFSKILRVKYFRIYNTILSTLANCVLCLGRSFCNLVDSQSFVLIANAVCLTMISGNAYSAVNAKSLSNEILKDIERLVDKDTARLVDLYKDLHQNPELAFTEKRTARIIADELKKLGYSVTEGIGKTGVVGVLKNGNGPTLWFRADMDANSVKESTSLLYAAKVKQKLPDGSEVDVMHACGHDAHVVWLLGFAHVMAELKSEWSGTLVVYGQPAEELGVGAKTMVEEGLWKKGFPKPDYAFGLHAAPIAVGTVASAAGVRMAGTDQLDIVFKGIGGHGSMPQMTVDPVVMSAQAILGYQSIISRNTDPQQPAVLTVGSVVAGRDNNVIPDKAQLKLNLRWFEHSVRDQLLKRIDEVNNGVAQSAGLKPKDYPTRTMKGNSDPLVNDVQLVEGVNPNFKKLLGEKNVVESFPAVMGSEDFQEVYKSLKTPYHFVLIGVAPVDLYAKAVAAGKHVPYSNHNSDFRVDLKAIPIGVSVNSVMALSLLKK